MDIKGWVKNSLIDYPDHIATLVFTGGCNFRCPMCHNAELVLRERELPSIPEQDVFSYLDKRIGLIDGVVISGGEPTLQEDLLPFLHRLKSYGLDIKLDTNGSRPNIIKRVLDDDVVDFVAMDIKAPPDKYAILTGLPNYDALPIRESLHIIVEKHVPFELRTTVVPQLLEVDDITTIGQWLSSLLPETSVYSYVLQQFRALHTLDPALRRLTPYSKNQLEQMALSIQKWLPSVKIRGI